MLNNINPLLWDGLDGRLQAFRKIVLELKEFATWREERGGIGD